MDPPLLSICNFEIYNELVLIMALTSRLLTVVPFDVWRKLPLELGNGLGMLRYCQVLSLCL